MECGRTRWDGWVGRQVGDVRVGELRDRRRIDFVVMRDCKCPLDGVKYVDE